MMNVPIRSSTRQHLVDTKDVEGVHTNPQVERVFASGLCYVFVGTNTRSLKRFTGELLILVGNQVTAEGELIDRSTLPAEVKDADLARNCVSGSVVSVTLTTGAPWSPGRHGYTVTWDTACSCNTGSSELGDDPL
jgi:hypothetical protein